MTTVNIPHSERISAFWTQVINPAVAISELWTSYPDIMATVSNRVYQLRETGPASSSESISLQRSQEIIAKIQQGVGFQDIAVLYPREFIMFGHHLLAVAEGELDHSPKQIERFKELLRTLKAGFSLDQLTNDYADLLVTGAYDLIHLDKWLKTEVYPN